MVLTECLKVRVSLKYPSFFIEFSLHKGLLQLAILISKYLYKRQYCASGVWLIIVFLMPS